MICDVLVQEVQHGLFMLDRAERGLPSSMICDVLVPTGGTGG